MKRILIKQIPLGQKAKPGRKKRTTTTLLFKPDGPVPEVLLEDTAEENDTDEYDLDAAIVETDVPYLPYLPVTRTGRKKRKGDEENYE